MILNIFIKHLYKTKKYVINAIINSYLAHLSSSKLTRCHIIDN